MHLDVVGLGYCVYDLLAIVTGLPDFDHGTIAPLADLAHDGGGQVGTALTALARLGLRTGYVGLLGDPVFAATDGRVQYAEFNYGGYGNLVMIMRPDGTQTRYAHLHKIKDKKGDRVSAGDLIGTMGSTGKSSGSHLHFEVRVGPALTPTNPAGLWTGSRPGIPAKPPAWACRNFGC